MKIHLMSDLHLDHDPHDGEDFLDSLEDGAVDDVDVLILAGDNYSVQHSMKDLFLRLLDIYDHVVYVPGNHDYWRSSPAAANTWMLKDAQGSSRLHLVLEPQRLMVYGQEFVCGTMWYRRPEPGQRCVFIDEMQTDDLLPWVWEQQQKFQALLYAGPVTDAVVVTHHLPSHKSTPLEFKDSPNNHFFVCDMLAEIEGRQPKLWLHGHTHTACDYHIGATRVVCHPRGYPFEWRSRADYRPLLIEVP